MDYVQAVQMLREQGIMRVSTPGFYPSINEQEAHAILLKTPNESYWQQLPSGAIVLRPKLGMGATLCYPNDSYPYEVVKIVSPLTVDVRELTTAMNPEFNPEVNSGGFVGRVGNSEEQRWIYSSNPTGKVMRVHLNRRGKWMGGGSPFWMGTAKRYYDVNL